MAFYEDMQKVASDILGAFDQGTIVYIAVVPGNGPADDPGPPVETPYKVNGAARGASFKYLQNGLAVAGDLQVTVAVRPDITFDMNGFVEISGRRLKVVQVVPKPAAGVPAAYTLIVRNA